MNGIIPQPNKFQKKQGQFLLGGDITVKSSARYAQAAEKLAGMIRSSYTSVNITDNSDRLIELSEVTYLGQEEYVIDCSPSKLEIKASKRAGLLYAVGTLYMMLELHSFHHSPTPIDCFYIADKPRFRWRGIMLDEARHFFGKDTVLKLIDMMCINKLNVLHWHLSDDQGYRLESKAFPLLHEIGSKRSDTQIGGENSNLYEGTGHEGYYTFQDIKEIVEKARRHNILIVPHIELPAHTTAMAAAYPQYFCNTESVPVATSFGRKDTLLCAGDKAAYEFVFALLDEICALFPSPYIGIGGADVNTAIWAECERCKQFMAESDIADADALKRYFINYLSARLKAKGRRMICCNSSTDENTSYDVIGKYMSPKDDKSIPLQLRMGRSFIVSRPQYLSFDAPYCQTPLKKTYEYDPDKDIKGCRYLRGKIMGMEAALWTEWISDKEKFDMCLYPRMAVLAEACWSEPAFKSFKSFKARLPKHKRMLSDSGVGYAKDGVSMPGGIINRYKRLYYYNLNDKNVEVRNNREHD